MLTGMQKCLKSLSFERLGGFVFAAIALFAIGVCFDMSAVGEFADLISVLIIISSLIFVIFGLLLLCFRKRFTTKNIIIVITVGSLILKIAYILKHPYTVNQHDIEMLGGSGHLEYIYRLANLKGLPDSNEWQFYNPPLQHFFSAVVFKLGDLFGFSQRRCFENIQLLSVFWTISTSIVFYKLLRELKFKGFPLVLTYAVVAYHPTMTIFSGSINNDPLTLLLLTCSLLYTVRWQNTNSLNDIAITGVFCGFAMMTKYSAFFVAFAIFFYVFIKSCFMQKNILKGSVAFCIPVAFLGLWYQIRNAFLFGQKIVHYNDMGNTSLLYVPKTFIRRLTNLPDVERTVYCAVFSDTNIPAYFIKSSIFGEYTFNSETISIVLLILNIVLIMLSLVSLIYIFKLKKSAVISLIWPFVFVLIAELLFYLWFNYIQPYGCNMDFRLIPVTLICGVVFLGLIFKELHIKSRDNKFALAAYIALTVVVLAFSVFSTLLFI